MSRISATHESREGDRPSGPFDVGIYDNVVTELFEQDRRSLLAVQDAVRRRLPSYSYLEIGSHLGGSLQPFLHDPVCLHVYSIDPRPPTQPDQRGVAFAYPENSTQRMIEMLTPAYGPALAKLRTFESDARDVPGVDAPPDICFIDGEHTDAAVLSDFRSTLRLAAPNAVIAFDDLNIIFRGYAQCLAYLREQRIEHRSYVLPMKIGVIELRDSRLWSDAVIVDRLASVEAFLFLAETLGHYRDGILALKRLPGAELVRRVVARLPFGGALRPRANPYSGEYTRKQRSD